MKSLKALRVLRDGSLISQAVAANFLPVGITLVTVLALMAGTLALQSWYLEREVRLRAETLAQFLARQCAFPLLVDDRRALDEIAGAVLGLDDVLYVALNDASDATVVAQARPEFGPLQTAGSSAGAGRRPPWVEAVAQVVATRTAGLLEWDTGTQRRLGLVRVGLSTQRQRVHLRFSLAVSILLALLASATILAVQYRQMRKVLRPLQGVVAAATSVARGDLAARAPVARRDEVGRLAEAFNQMVAELQRSRQQLLQALEEARQASRAKSEFLANMSHELRTPLNAMLGMTELALENSPAAELAEYLTTIRSAAESLLAIVNDILDFSRIEAGKLELNPTPFHLKQELAALMGLFVVLARGRNLSLRWEVADGIPDWVAGDVVRWRQILTNLLSNAIKFTAEGEVALEVKPAGSRNGEVVLEFTVRDTGIGIPSSEQARIFEAFTQVDASASRRYGGAGLGLAISARLASLMGGNIAVESEPGRGSCFTVTLPFLVCEAPRPSPGEPVTPGGQGSLRVLLAEDTEINQRLVVRALEKRGHQVTVARNGVEALVATEREPFDVVLMDVQMPEMDGLEATRRIRARERETGGHVPILALTAHALKGDRERCLEAGMDGYISKPVQLAALEQAIQEAVQRARGGAGSPA